jgi:hypothetical protein
MSIEEQRTSALTDLLGLEHHLLEALGGQRRDDDVRLQVHVNEVIIRMERCARDHYEALKIVAAGYGVEESRWKKTLGSVTGKAAGLLEKARSDQKLSGLLRDNYVFLSLLAMQYTSAHAFAIAIRDEPLAARCLEHLMDVTPLMVALSRVIPEVVVEETGREHLPAVDITAGRIATDNTQRAWRPEVTEAS